MPPTPTPPIRTPRPTPPTNPKSQKKKWLALTALLTSTPFLIAIAVHLLALLGLGSVVIFKGGNPLAMFTSENVDSTDSAPESSAPPSADDSPPEDSAPAMAETTPTETDTSTEILALSTPTTVPTFAPTAPAKLTAPTTTPGQGSAGTGTKSGGGGGKGRRTSKSTLFGFSETTEDDLVGTMYDLKLDSSGRKPTDLGTVDTDFYGAVRGILSGNRVNPAALRKYFAVQKKLGATQIFMPMGQASEAPKIFGVADKVKPNYWLIHYRGRCAAPTSGQFRFVGKADDLLWVAVDGRTVLEAHWDTSQSLTGWKPKDHIDEYSIVDFMEGNTDEDRAKAHLVFGDWMNWEAGKPHEIELLLGEYGGGRFFGLLLIEQKEKETKLGKNKERPVLPLFVTAEPDAEQKNTARRSKLEFPKETPVFAVSGSAGAGPSSSPSAAKTPQPPAETKPPASSANSDSAADPAYGTDWKNESTAGLGFGPWQLVSNANPSQKTFAGFYLAEEKDKPNITPVASNGRAWGLFANGDNFPKACAFRPLSQPLAPGQSLSLDILCSPFPESSAKGGSVGLSLRQGTTAASPDDYNANSRFELCALQDKPNLQIFDGEKESSTTFPSSTLAFRLTFLLKTSDTYDLKLEPLPLGQGSPVELKNRHLGGTANSPIESLVLFNRNGQTDSWCNHFQISTP
jgi:hypothetical protein